MSKKSAPLSAEDAANKQLKIQVECCCLWSFSYPFLITFSGLWQLGICRRMVKEVASYEKEVLTNENRVQKMRDDGLDSYGE